MAQRHVVILGGTGFVGRHLVARLLQGGDRVTVLSRGVDADKRRLKPQGASLIEGDVADADFLAAVLDDADAVVNLIGILNEKGDRGDGFERVFVGITDALIDAM